ncbi:Fatty acyl-CoA reductase [Cytospora mali]|uniref:Fatty acyl-CoA reductase n=1 Tax=Cytospora mali TaxID=578113 RepID=A0A194W1L6_CYTMA|nr:Fatty acyl-CoA reductase [Valsa mali]
MVSTTINPELPKFTTPKRPLTWLITGCSSGFGLAIARKAQASGHKVIATSRNPDKTPELVQEIESNGGKWAQLDLDDPNNASVIDGLEAEGLHIDVLVNNAGFGLLQAVEHFREDEVRAQFETVFFGPYRITRAALPYMRGRRFGIIVNISTGSSLEARESMAVYGAAKAAFDGVAKTMAREVSEFNIRTLIVFLGGFNTPMGTSVVSGKDPVAEDYKGTRVDETLEFMKGGEFVPDGDTLKAVEAIYEVAMGEGIGAGTVGELFLPLGREMEDRVRLVRDRLDHCWEVFGDVATNVYLEK